MKTVMLCLVMLLIFAFPVAGKTTILESNVAFRVKCSNICDKVSMIQLAENGKNEDDPATDDGEDLRDGDSDSNSNDDSDKDNG